MKFSMQHQFECSPERLWEVFQSPAFEALLEERTRVRRETLWKREEGGQEVSRILCASLREMPAPMAKALGTSNFRFEQENRFDRARDILHWKVIPTVMADRVEASGTTRVQALSGGGCVRTVEGMMEVRLPLVGKAIEQKLGEQVQQSYEEAASIARELIARG